MKIAGIQKTTLIDFPGKIAAILFTQGCQFRCGFCHNPELLPLNGPVAFTEKEVLEFLTKRRKVLEGVVITGGEPTLQPDLLDFIKKVKALGYAIKLDTNGGNPVILEKIIKSGLVDYIAMDVKAPLDKYKIVTGVKVLPASIKKSIKLIMDSGLAYEFRSTILPHFHTPEDITAMAKLITGSKLYYLQKFLTQGGKLWDKSLASAQAFSDKEMAALAKACGEFVERCEVR